MEERHKAELESLREEERVKLDTSLTELQQKAEGQYTSEISSLSEQLEAGKVRVQELEGGEAAAKQRHQKEREVLVRRYKQKVVELEATWKQKYQEMEQRGEEEKAVANASFEAQLSALQVEKQSLNERVSNLQADIEGLRVNVAEMESQQAVAREEKEKLEAELSQVRTDFKSLSVQLEEKSREYEVKLNSEDSRYQGTSAELLDCRERLTQCEELCRKKEDELRELKEKVAEVEETAEEK